MQAPALMHAGVYVLNDETGIQVRCPRYWWKAENIHSLVSPPWQAIRLFWRRDGEQSIQLLEVWGRIQTRLEPTWRCFAEFTIYESQWECGGRGLAEFLFLVCLEEDPGWGHNPHARLRDALSGVGICIYIYTPSHGLTPTLWLHMPRRQKHTTEHSLHSQPWLTIANYCQPKVGSAVLGWNDSIRLGCGLLSLSLSLAVGLSLSLLLALCLLQTQAGVTDCTLFGLSRFTECYVFIFFPSFSGFIINNTLCFHLLFRFVLGWECR